MEDKLLQIKSGQELYTNDSGFEKIQKITNIYPQDPNLIYKIENGYNSPGFYNVRIDYINKTIFTDAIYLKIRKSKMGEIMEEDKKMLNLINAPFPSMIIKFIKSDLNE